MGFLENIRIALRSVSANWLRAILTLIIIAFGIMALVGILTAIDSAIYSLNDNLSYLGANSFDIDPKGGGISGNRGGRRAKRGEPFSYEQAHEFKERFIFPAKVSLAFWGGGGSTVKFADRKTNPNVNIIGADDVYIEARGFELAAGRNITAREAETGSPVAVIGNALVEDLFQGDPRKAIDKTVLAGDNRYRVIGALKSKGSSMRGNDDRRIIIPLQTAKRFYGTSRTNYNIYVTVNDASRVDQAIGNATAVLRNVRRLRAGEENDFEMTKSDGLISIIKENTLYLRAAAIAIGLITLLGAAIGLMNIMLVSVTERTREIGIRKAMGATSRNILLQFLVEAVVICQMGGILGIILGIMIGNVVTILLGGSFIFPWLWITVALITCTAVGLLSGLYPSMKAAALDPIESLRYE